MTPASRLPVFMACILAVVPAGAETLHLLAQSRVPAATTSWPAGIVQEEVLWEGSRTAILICDMWDNHTCIAARERVAEMVPTMNRLLKKARSAGVLVVHCPSDTMDFYEGWQQRERAKSAPHSDLPNPDGWKHLSPEHEPEMPVDASGFACDSAIDGEPRRVWSRQIETLEIADQDALSDSGQEIHNLLTSRGIDRVLILGVHTNLCVLGRPFGIRAMVLNGYDVALVRDLTDAMATPTQAPFVDHFRANDLVIAHIETFWCPTVLSSSLTGEPPFVFQSDHRPRVGVIAHEEEYRTRETLPELAESELAAKRGWHVEYLLGSTPNFLSGLEVLPTLDGAVVSVRRQVLPPEQMRAIRAYCESGQPLVGIRTASHAFLLRDEEPPAGFEDWQSFDADLFGGNYTNHHGNKNPEDPRTTVWIDTAQKDHPILRGLSREPFETRSWLYKVLPLAEGTQVLMWGKVGDRLPHEPVAWTNRNRWGGRVFYTSLGHPEDFREEGFRSLLVQGIEWALKAE